MKNIPPAPAPVNRRAKATPVIEQPSDEIAFTISVLCHNNLHFTRQCLDSIFRHTANFQLIVTDNASSDGTKEYLEALAGRDARVKIITNDANLGFIKPHNAALVLADSEFFIVLNNDTEVCAEWAPKIRQVFRDRPKVALVGIKGACCAWDANLSGYYDSNRLDYIEASCLMIPTALAKTHGLFSTYLIFAYCEDADLSLRMREMGYEIAQVDIPIIHHQGKTSAIVRQTIDIDAIHRGNQDMLKNRWPIFVKRRDFLYQILIVRAASSGDVLFTTPIIDALKRKWPQSEIRVQTKFPGLLDRNAAVTEAYSDDRGRGQYDIVYDLDLAYEREPKKHILDTYAAVCGVTLDSRDSKLTIVPTADELTWAEAFTAGRRVAVVHAGPTIWPGRDWPKDRFEEVIDHLKLIGLKVAVVGSAANWQFESADWNLNGQTTPSQMAALLSRCVIFFGVDSFPSNVAQNRAAASIILFGTIDPVYRLCSPTVTALRGDPEQAPCIGEHHRLPAPMTFSTCAGECMRAISVESAIQTINKVLGPAYRNVVYADRKVESGKAFLHSGDLGDIVAAMPAMRDLGGGTVYLVSTPSITKHMTPERFSAIKPLLKAQEYIEDVKMWNHEPITHNFANFRSHYRRNLNLSQIQAMYIGTNTEGSLRPWIHAVPKPNGRVVIHRSPRHQNDLFPWRGLIRHFGKRLLYCGVRFEYEEFARGNGDVEFYETRDLLELAEMIAGSELFVGNQSSPYWIAEGLKHRCILEQSIRVPDSNFDRPDCLRVIGDSFYWDRSLIENPTLWFATNNGSRPIKVNSLHFVKWRRGACFGGACEGLYATNHSGEIAALMAQKGSGVREVDQEEYLALSK